MVRGADWREARRGRETRSDALEPAGRRVNYVVFLWKPPPPTYIEAIWLHPMPLRMKQDVTSPNRAEWSLMEVSFCGRVFPTATALRQAYERGEVRVCPFLRDCRK